MAQGALAQRLAAAGLDWIVPDWPAPPCVAALSTTRNGRAGQAFDPVPGQARGEAALAELRQWLPADPVWLTQVHGASVCDADAASALPRGAPPVGDAALARRVGTVCAVQSADCLPLLLSDRRGGVVAAVHAGWRGLAAGVIEAALSAMRIAPADACAWLGPAIGPRAFEVGADVLAAHCAGDPGAADGFTPHGEGKWLGDLDALARRRLRRAGVTAIHGGGRCTVNEPARFYSYRRDGPAATGRMATLIWIEGG